jgi:hypothetical protein
MPTTIDDKIITDSLYLNRFDAGERKKVKALLKDMRKDLLAALDEKYILESKKRQINSLIAQIDEIINGYYQSLSTQLDIEAQFLHSVENTREAVQSAIPVNTMASIPSPSHMKAIISDILFDGASLSAWWDKQSEDAKFRFSGIIRKGIAQGIEYDKLISQVNDFMALSERNAFGLIHTSIHTVANHARMSVFEANADVIKSLIWRTTLDSHVCLKCIGRSNKKWTVDKKPIGHSIPFQLPSIHIRDRCVISAQSIFTPDQSHPDFTRASSIGQVDAQITFDEYLKRVPTEQVYKMLGKGRYELWKSGKITTSQLLDQTGRELTLDELSN